MVDGISFPASSLDMVACTMFGSVIGQGGGLVIGLERLDNVLRGVGEL